MKKLLCCLVLLAAFPAHAQVMQRSVTVSGEAREQVSPDQAILSMSLVSRDKDLSTAKRANDAMVEKLVQITGGFKIPKEKIGTSNVQISPEYSYVNNKQEFKGYIVNRSLTITMDELAIHERVLSAIVDAKIDQVNGVDFRLAKPEARADALRVKAVENARTKADALAKAAGAKLGAVLTIAADGNMMPIPAPRPMMAKAMMADSASVSVAPSLPGMVELQQSVTVTYGLE